MSVYQCWDLLKSQLKRIVKRAYSLGLDERNDTTQWSNISTGYHNFTPSHWCITRTKYSVGGRASFNPKNESCSIKSEKAYIILTFHIASTLWGLFIKWVLQTLLTIFTWWLLSSDDVLTVGSLNAGIMLKRKESHSHYLVRLRRN